MSIYIEYIGEGSILPGVPTKDMTKEEADKFNIDDLLKSKIYRLKEEKKTVKKKRSVKHG